MNKTKGKNIVKGMWKKTVAWILMLNMVLSLAVVMFPVTAMAATQTSAKRYMDNNMGRQISSSRGNQCVELYNQYLEKVFGRRPPSFSYAYQIYDKDHPGWQKIPASQIKEYRVGDIVVYNPGNGKDVGVYGHVALVYSVSNGKVVKLFEQNWGGNPKATLWNWHSARLRGIIRPTFDNDVSPTKLTITSSMTLNINESKKISASFTPSNVSASKKGITWQSSNSSVATVDSNGQVRGIKAGTATITATCTANKNAYAKCKVTVNGRITSTSVSISRSSLTLNRGNTATITASVNPSNASNRSITWSSSNTSVAKVSNGKITAVNGGTAVITAKAGDGKSYATCVVTVLLPNGVYRLKHVGTGKMMNYAWGWKEFAYKPIFLYNRDGSVEQTFRFRHISNGKYEIDIMHKEGGVMNVWTSKTVAEGQKIGSWSKTYDDTQRFIVTFINSNTVILRSAQNSNLAVAPDGSSRGYLKLVRYNANDKNQQWVIENN